MTSPYDHLMVFLIYSLLDGHLSCFQFRTIVINAGMNNHIQIFCEYIFISFDRIPRNKIAGTFGSLYT